MSRNPYPVAPPEPDPEALGFEPFQPMVRWFTPSELTRAGAESLISSLFGAYADNRELQAVRDDIEAFDYARTEGGAPRDEIWIDYVADLGDGWDSTYAVASLLAAPTLDVGGVETRRGDVLVLGGDQVYPTAKKEEYQNRFAGPYRAALPYVREEPPHLFAVPGNHDWYDGLTSFTRLFCQDRWIGGWKTRQRRSYFALRLPHDWWLWGIDVQLSADIDRPQMQFFEELGAQIAAEEGPARIVLCTAEPSWASAGSDERMADYDTLAYFEAQAMHRHGHRHVVGLAGDMHCYARWEHADGRQRFVSGGGGAYLYPTHRFCDALRLPTEPGPAPNRATETFTLGSPSDGTGEPAEALFPPAATSRGLAARALGFPLLNKRFSLFFGAFYLFLAWLVQSASKSIDDVPVSFLERLAEPIAFGEMAYRLGEVLAHAPLAFLTALVLFAGLTAFADGSNWVWKAALGAAHTAAHLLAFVGLTWGFVEVNLGVLGLTADSLVQALLFTAEMLSVGSLVAGVIWGVYLYLTHLAGRHTNDVFSCQGIADYKHVLRLHIDRDGGLTIYPIGIERVPRDWAYRPGADGTPWFVPEGPTIAERARLVEPPIRVPTATRGPASHAGDGAGSVRSAPAESPRSASER